jgi:vacuolar-type H+-ATPase subunit I/STV1
LAASVFAVVLCGAIVWKSSIQYPSIAAVAALLATAVAVWCWRRPNPTLPRHIGLVALAIFALAASAAFLKHYDGTAKREREASQAAARLEQERLAVETAQRKEMERLEQARREEEQRQELARRDKEVLENLKKTNVDQYLVFLKTKDMALWLQEAKTLRPKLYAAHVAEEQRQAEESQKRIEISNQKDRPLDYLTLDTALSKGGFDTVLLATFTIKSTLSFPVHDIAVLCRVLGNSGTELQEISQTIYDVMPPGASKRFEVNLGFVHSQGTRAICRIAGVKW